MTQHHALWRHCAAASLLALLAACGGGGGDDNTGTAGNGGTTPVETPGGNTALDHPSGLYSSWTTELVPFTNPQGFTYYYSLFKYTYAKYFDNGLVYVGPPTPDFDAVQCTAPSKDANGNDLCVAYSVSNGQITIGSETPVPLQKTADGWSIDGRDLKPLPLLPAGTTLDGSYTSRSCYLALCSQATFVFRPDGTFTASRFNSYANTIGDVFTGAGGGSDETGTYHIEGRAITMNPQGAKGGRLFFFIDGTSLQIGEDWYSKDE